MKSKGIPDIIKKSIYKLDSGFVGMTHPDEKPYTIRYRYPFNDPMRDMTFSQVFVDWAKETAVKITWYENNREREIVVADENLNSKFDEVRKRLQNEYYSIIMG